MGLIRLTYIFSRRLLGDCSFSRPWGHIIETLTTSHSSTRILRLRLTDVQFSRPAAGRKSAALRTGRKCGSLAYRETGNTAAGGAIMSSFVLSARLLAGGVLAGLVGTAMPATSVV